MSKMPASLRYARTHEWARQDEDGAVTVGITDHAQEALGDVVFVELPTVGAQVAAADPCATVESVKAASDIYAPLAGEVVEVNEALGDAPERLNESPYGEGWIFRLQPNDTAELERLLDAEGYRASLAD